MGQQAPGGRNEGVPAGSAFDPARYQVQMVKAVAPPRFGPAGLAVRGGRVDVGGHEAAAEAPDHDEATLAADGVKHVEARYLWVQDRVRRSSSQWGERLQELVRMVPVVVGEFEPTKLPKKLLGALFLASQVTQVQGDDESTAVAQYEEKYEEVIPHYRLLVLVVLVYFFGFVSGVLVMVLVRFVANYMFGGRYAEPPVICVEAGAQVDLLA